VVGWNDTTSTVSSVTDTRGNTTCERSVRRLNGVDAINLLREEHCSRGQHGDSGFSTKQLRFRMYGFGVQWREYDEPAGCDGGSIGNGFDSQ